MDPAAERHVHGQELRRGGRHRPGACPALREERAGLRFSSEGGRLHTAQTETEPDVARQSPICACPALREERAGRTEQKAQSGGRCAGRGRYGVTYEGLVDILRS